MKNLKYVFIGICMFSLLAHARVVPKHTLAGYENAFTIESLKKHVINNDEDALNRAIFPAEAFKLETMDSEKLRNIMNNYFSQNEAIILYETAYLHVFNYMRASALVDLQKELLSTYFSLHDLIVKTSIVPFIAAIYREKQLGLIEDEKSPIREMMKTYVEYFFGSLRKSHTIDRGPTDNPVTHILATDRCPGWLVWRLNRASMTRHSEFDAHYVKLTKIRTAMSELNRHEPMREETQRLLKGYGVSIRQLLPDLVDGDDDKSQELRRDIGNALIEIMKVKYELKPSQTKENNGLDCIILHRDLRKLLIKSKSVFVNQITKKKRTLSLKKKITTYEFINGVKLKEIVNDYMEKKATGQK